jgi:Putative DNA-binding domain
MGFNWCKVELKERIDSGTTGHGKAFFCFMKRSRRASDMRYTLGTVLPLDESRLVEFKEIRGNNPVSAIVNAADEYAVAFLNSEGGRILWGVRDDGMVVGVSVNHQQRNQLRRDVVSQLHSIQPQIDPTQFELELHPLGSVDGAPHPLYVVELVVPAGASNEPYFTGGHEVFVRVDGVKKKLTGPQLTAWIRRRSASLRSESIAIRDPATGALVSRVRRALSEHGLEPGHLARFFAAMNAPFVFNLQDGQTDAAFLGWLDETKLDWIAETFSVRREWIDGEDEQVHRRWFFDKNPREFWAAMCTPTTTIGSESRSVTPEAYFIRWGKGPQWAKKGDSAVFVVLAIPLCQLSDERVVYKYVSDFTPYPWTYRRSNIQLRAWARLLYCQGGFIINGREMTYETGEKLAENSGFLRHFLDDRRTVSQLGWHPDDYALSDTESVVAKEVETFSEVLAFLRQHDLPIKVRPGSTLDRQK